MNLRKLFLIIKLYIFTLIPSYAVEVVRATPPSGTEQFTSTFYTFWYILLGFSVFVLLGGLVILAFAMIILKIQRTLSNIYRRRKDFIFSIFERDVEQCHINRDPKMKYKNWKRLWITFKRHPVFVRDPEQGLIQVGSYNGQTYKKESFFMVSLYHKVNMIKYTEQIILIPNSIKHKVQTLDVDGKVVMVIDECYGLDQVGNTNYYFQPLMKTKKQDKDFLDFSDLIHMQYFEKTIMRDVVKETAMTYREGVVDAIEMNPKVHMNRRGGNE